MTSYFTQTGSFADALIFLCNNGGLLFKGRSQDHPNVVVRGSHVHTWWPSRSGLRGQVTEACNTFGFDPEHATAGRLARFILKEIVRLPEDESGWDGHYLRIARQGWHWHHMHCTPGYHGPCGEFDIKGAYAASLLSGESFLYDRKRGYLDDSGALENLRNLLPVIPKWLRMVLLGVVASYELSAYTLDKSNPEGNLKEIKIRKVSHGAAFNAVHLAILRLYGDMAKILEIGEDDIVRTHTDCFWMKLSIEETVEEKIWKYLKKRGYEIACKRFGNAFLEDVNCGVIGGHRVGVPDRLRDLKERQQEKMRLAYERIAYPSRWKEIPYLSAIPTKKEAAAFLGFEGEQIDLFDVM